MSGSPRSLWQELDSFLGRPTGPDWEAVLDRVVREFACDLGTLHVLEKNLGLLHLRAAKDLPPPVLEKVQKIPIGKGMAGLAAERREPVQVCNLQQDETVVRPGAKLTKAEGSIAVPMLAGKDLVGVLGVAKRVPYDFSAGEIQALLQIAERLAQHLTAAANR